MHYGRLSTNINISILSRGFSSGTEPGLISWHFACKGGWHANGSDGATMAFHYDSRTNLHWWLNVCRREYDLQQEQSCIPGYYYI